MASRTIGILRWIWRQLQWVGALVLIALVLLAANLLWRLNIDRAETFADPVAQFKYGSTGGDKNFGFPYPMWEAMPVLFKKFLPEGRQDEGWAALGFLYEDDKDLPREGLRRRRPVGTSLRNHMGIDRVFLNCAGCHAGRVRTEEGGKAVIYAGMPANTLDLSAFQEFLRKAAISQDFTPERFLAQIDAMGIRLGFINRLALRYYGVALARTQILLLADRFKFLENEPTFGPGRFDTFSPANALLNWNFEHLQENERIGVVDFPSIWLQKKKEGMHLHWDGNNTNVQERNRSAAFGTGATPAILDRASIRLMEKWLENAEPPKFVDLFPGQLDSARATRGAEIFKDNCAACHGKDGRDFSGGRVGTVAQIAEIGTDPSRLDSYTYELSLSQNVLYPNIPEERFQSFRKTDGYAVVPLDGIWLRAPYLHNGSVPSLWALLQRPTDRPRAFLRGHDVYDPVDVGFESRPEKIPQAVQGKLFCYVTHEGADSRCPAGKRPVQGAKYKCDPGGGICKGNGNLGHAFGTDLSDDHKRDLIEHLKTF
jgi:RoxA-like, cytochrome c-like/Cytochrome c